ncbi:MAG: HAD hydrolase family protein [Lachnospiraceae bacterium]|nr:HAD hydrolase family protein [Lachnospiraceae bacterium]
MKYAVLADIHGNLQALETVLSDAAKQGADGYIFAGDYCLSGPYPNECLKVIREMPNAYIVRGNEESYLEKLNGTDPKTWTDGQMQISYYSYRAVPKENRDYLEALPHTIDIACSGVSIHIAHDRSAFLGKIEGTHWSSFLFGEKYGNAPVTKEQLDNGIRKDNDADEMLQERLRELPDGVYIFGHTHIQWSYRSKDGRIVLINPGSCGLPLDCLAGTVPYVILEVSDDGKVSVDERRVTFDVKGYAESLTKSAQYEQAKVWTKVIMKEILTAREHLMPFLRFLEEYANRIGDSRRPFAVETWEKGYEIWNRTIQPYRAIIVDLDRTLLHSDKSITDDTKKVLSDWQEAGAQVFIASARPERAITEYRDALGVTSVVTLNGARSVTPHGTEANAISTESAAAILAELEAIPGTVISIEAESGLYSNIDIPIWQPIVTEDLAGVAKRDAVYKILASHPDMPPESLAVPMPDDVYCTVADRKLIQFMARTATKWNGILQLLQNAGIPAEQAVYFGDDNDDIEPIVKCGLGVAVANALPEVKTKADAVTLSNDEDGVAVFLRRLEDGFFCK